MNSSLLKLKALKISKKAVGIILRIIFLSGFCFVILYPVILMISRGFMSRVDLMDNEVILIFKNFTLENFKVASMLLDYGTSFKNTIIITLGCTLFSLIASLLAGYAFGRYNFKLKPVLFGILLFTIIVPPQLIMMPLYMKFKSFDILGIIELINGSPANLLNSFAPFFILSITGMGIKSGIFIYLFRQFFAGMPREIEEAAMVDGAGSFRIFATLMVPNAKTIIVMVILFSIVWQYNDVVYSQLFLTTQKVLSMQYVNLERFTQEVLEFLEMANGDIMVGMYVPLVKSAGALIILAPIIIMFLVAQKFFVESIERSGIVG
ncbi:MAG: carbohydrate ABC transporter permease [Ruminococcaceae bacterium]|nr:carbohydrate ABC transporter permease [Oscillospiraceae bacterium]